MSPFSPSSSSSMSSKPHVNKELPSSSSFIISSKDDQNQPPPQTHLPLPKEANSPSKLDYSSTVSHFDHNYPQPPLSNNKVVYLLFDSKEFICGWGSALINTCVTFPINKLIFRQQLHGISGWGAVRQLRKDGLHHFYRGLLPPLLQKTTSISIMFGVYTKSRNTLENALPSLSPRTNILLSALIAGSLEATLTPFERVQTLMQTRKYHNKFSNTFDAFRTLWRYGPTEYYRGLSVILIRNGPSNCLFFLGREYLLETNATSSAGEKIAKDFVSGACLGALISTFFFPFNVMKTHMQAQIGGPWVNIATTFRNVLAERDGKVRHLFKGLHLNYTRSFISWGIINASYEILMKGFKRVESSRKH